MIEHISGSQFLSDESLNSRNLTSIRSSLFSLSRIHFSLVMQAALAQENCSMVCTPFYNILVFHFSMYVSIREQVPCHIFMVLH